MASSPRKRDSVYVALANGSSKIIALVTTLAVASLLDSENFGLVSFALISSNLISGLGGLALPSVLTREMVQREHESRNQFWASLVLCVSLITTVSIVLVLIVIAISPRTDSSLLTGITTWPMIIGIFASALGQGIYSLCIGALIAQSRFKLWLWLGIVQALVIGVASIVPALARNPGWVVLAAGLAQLVIACLAVPLSTTDLVRNNDVTTQSTAWRLLKVAFAPGLASQAITGSNWLTVAMLGALPNGLTLVGWYSIASRLVTGLAIIPQSLVTPAVPEINRLAGSREFVAYVRKTGGYVLLTGAVLAAITLLFAQLISFLGTSFDGAVPVLRAMSFVIPLMAASTLLGSALLAIHHSRAWAWSDFLLAGIGVAAAALLIPPLGAVGLAFANIGAFLVVVLVRALLVSNLKAKIAR